MRRRKLGVAVCVVLAGAALGGCGVEGKVTDYGEVTVWSEPGSMERVGTLTTMAPVTVDCFTDGYFKISYDGGSGYVDTGTEILSDEGVVNSSMVPEC
jgi:hypothetical protein